MSNLAPTDEATDIDGTCSSIICTISPRERDIGGFKVRRVLPDARHQMVGPWIFFDEMGPNQFEAGKGLDVRPHPHINLATVTYLFEGEIMHRDSLGYTQPIRPGEINLMIAGSGIVHSERTPDELRQESHKAHGLQLWLALPDEAEEMHPDFLHYSSGQIPEVSEPGMRVKMLIGSGYGLTSPVKSLSPTFYVEIQLEKGKTVTLPDEVSQRGLYLVTGELDAHGSEIKPQTMTIFAHESGIEVTAKEDSHFVIIGGEPVGERHIWWNFVSSRPERIEQAKEDWSAGRFEHVQGETESIPLPQ